MYKNVFDIKKFNIDNVADYTISLASARHCWDAFVHPTRSLQVPPPTLSPGAGGGHRCGSWGVRGVVQGPCAILRCFPAVHHEAFYPFE